jgi:hypothetical protein
MASFDNTSSKPTGQGADASGNRPASTSTSPTSGERFSSSRHAGGAVTDDVKEIANDLTDKAGRVAGQAQQTASELGGQFAGAATRLADSQVKAGANLIQNVSKAATAAARELEQTSPEIGRYVKDAASSLETFAHNMRDRSVGDIFNTFSNFARRQPLTVMVGSVFAGFLITRFLKSSGERYSTMDRGDGSFDRDSSFDRDEGRSSGTGYESRGGGMGSSSMPRGYGSRAGEAGASRSGSGEDWQFGSPGRAGSAGSTAPGTPGRGSGPSAMTTDGTSGERDGR